MTDSAFQLSVWYIIAVAQLATAYAFWKWAQFLQPNGKIIHGLFVGYLVFGLWSLSTTIFGTVRHFYGFNDLYEGIGWLARLRSITGVAFTVFIASGLNLAARQAYHLTPFEKETVKAAYRAFTTLRGVLSK